MSTTYQDNKKEDRNQPKLMFCSSAAFLPVKLLLLVSAHNKYSLGFENRQN